MAEPKKTSKKVAPKKATPKKVAPKKVAPAQTKVIEPISTPVKKSLWKQFKDLFN